MTSLCLIFGLFGPVISIVPVYWAIILEVADSLRGVVQRLWQTKYQTRDAESGNATLKSTETNLDNARQQERREKVTTGHHYRQDTPLDGQENATKDRHRQNVPFGSGAIRTNNHESERGTECYHTMPSVSQSGSTTRTENAPMQEVGNDDAGSSTAVQKDNGNPTEKDRGANGSGDTLKEKAQKFYEDLEGRSFKAGLVWIAPYLLIVECIVVYVFIVIAVLDLSVVPTECK